MSTVDRIAERMRAMDKRRGHTHRLGYYTDRARPIAKARATFEEHTRFQQDPSHGRHVTQKRVPFKLGTKDQRELAKREKAFHYIQLTKKREENAATSVERALAKKAERAAQKAKRREEKEDADFTSIFGNMKFGGTRRRRHRHRRTRRSTRA